MKGKLKSTAYISRCGLYFLIGYSEINLFKKGRDIPVWMDESVPICSIFRFFCRSSPYQTQGSSRRNCGYPYCPEIIMGAPHGFTEFTYLHRFIHSITWESQRQGLSAHCQRNRKDTVKIHILNILYNWFDLFFVNHPIHPNNICRLSKIGWCQDESW